MRKFSGGSKTAQPDVTGLGAGTRLADDAVVGEHGGQQITGKDVREAEEFAETLDKLAALYDYVHANPDDKEAAERLILTIQYVQEFNMAAFLDVSLGLWQMYRRSIQR